MILLPTRNRIGNMRRFIEAYVATKATLPVQLIIDEDDLSYQGLKMPSHWPEPLVNRNTHDLNAAFNLGFEKHPDAHYYGIMADDIIPQSDLWDVRLRDACYPHYVAWGDDGVRQSDALEAPALCTHPFFGGNLVRAWGWIMSPYTNRHCQDIIWRDFARELNIGVFLPDVHTLHAHWQCERGEYDATYASQPSAKKAHYDYHNVYKNSIQFYEDVKRVKEKLGV